jgi:hypothetical protein
MLHCGLDAKYDLDDLVPVGLRLASARTCRGEWNP